jgi:hypothetical protein
MSLDFYILLPPTILAVTVLWVVAGLWCERNIPYIGSLVKEAVAMVCLVMWGMVFIGGVLLFFGTLLGLIVRLFAGVVG